MTKIIDFNESASQVLAKRNFCEDRADIYKRAVSYQKEVRELDRWLLKFGKYRTNILKFVLVPAIIYTLICFVFFQNTKLALIPIHIILVLYLLFGVICERKSNRRFEIDCIVLEKKYSRKWYYLNLAMSLIAILTNLWCVFVLAN